MQAGYRVKTQWPVGAYRIDMVVEGNGRRLAVECDGDRWHPAEKLEEDMARQAILERLGWRFVRIRGSQYFRNPDMAMKPIFTKLQASGIPAEGMVTTSKADLDGKELKDRIINIAQKLRSEWKDTGKHPVPQLNGSSPQAKLLDRTKSASFPPAKNAVPATPPQASISISKQVNVPAHTQGPVARTTNERVQPRTAREPISQTQNSKGEAFSLILFLQTRGLKVIDNRPDRGGIWVIGGNELATVMQMLATKGIHFKFMPGGVPYRSGSANHYVDGWFLRSYTDFDH